MRTLELMRSIKARFPLGDFFRAKRLFPLSASLITSANAMPTKEKVASREKSRLVENGLNWNTRMRTEIDQNECEHFVKAN